MLAMWRFALLPVFLTSGQHDGAPVCDTHQGVDEAEVPGLLQTVATDAQHRRGSSTPSKVKKMAFVHVPKTAGTSLNRALWVIKDAVGRKFIDGRWWRAKMNQEVQEGLAGDDRAIIVGEFVGDAYMELLRADGLGTVQLWTMLRNPLMRAMSQAWHLERLHHFDNFSTMPRLFSRSACNLTVPELCNQGMEGYETCELKCRAGGSTDCCGRFQSYHVQVLGEASIAGKEYAVARPRLPVAVWLQRESRSDLTEGLRAIMGRPGGNKVLDSSLLNLRTAINRVLNGTLQVGVAEYFQASICLVLDSLHEHDGPNATLFERCCQVVDQPGCPVWRHSNVHASSEEFYLQKYLRDKSAQKEILESNTEDCILYAVGLQMFIQRVRLMEAHHGVQVLDPHISGEWSCEGWLQRASVQ